MRERKRYCKTLQKTPWAPLLIGGFGLKEVAEWASERRQNVSGQTLLHELTAASACYKWAESEGLLDDDDWSNPFLAYRRKRMKNISRKRRVALTEKELKALHDVVKKTEPAFYPFFLAATATGWRLSTLAGLQWRDVTFLKDGAVRLKTRPDIEKMGKEVVAYATPQLAKYLRSIQRGMPMSLVLTKNGRAWTRYMIRVPLKRAVRNCKRIPDWKRFGDGESVKAFDFHSLRHCCRSILASRKHDPFVVGQVLGQSDPQTAMRYTHADESAKSAIAADLGAALGG